MQSSGGRVLYAGPDCGAEALLSGADTVLRLGDGELKAHRALLVRNAKSITQEELVTSSSKY